MLCKHIYIYVIFSQAYAAVAVHVTCASPDQRRSGCQRHQDSFACCWLVVAHATAAPDSGRVRVRRVGLVCIFYIIFFPHCSTVPRTLPVPLLFTRFCATPVTTVNTPSLLALGVPNPARGDGRAEALGMTNSCCAQACQWTTHRDACT
jgi:hypothetical protein